MSNLATIVNNILADSGIDDINVVVTTGSYSNPAWITALSWTKITDRPTTLAGYGITDAVPSSRTITINGTSQDLSANRTFNVGTVTSVAALTLGTSGTDLSSTVANGTTTPVITLNVPTASAANRGALSAADWTTFNNKQNALTNPVTGTGTTNFLPKFTGSTTIGNSIVSESGSLVSVIANSAGLRVTESGGADVRMVAGGSSGFFGTYSNHSLQFLTDSGTKMTLDASGNLGLGVTPSAWSSAFGSVLQFKSAGSNGGGALTGSGGSNFRMFANTFYDGSYKYIVNGRATQYEQDGYHAWYNAPSGTAGNAISFTQAMTLFATGNLLVGTPSPISDNGARLQVSGYINVTNQVIANNSITDPTNNNTLTNGTVYALNGVSTVNNFGIGLSAVRNENYDIWFQTGSINGGGYRFYRGTTELVTIQNSGNVGIGTTTDNGARLQVSGRLQVVSGFGDQIRFGTNTSVYTNISMGTGFTTFDSIGGDSGAYSFRDDGVTRMFIDSSGNVGIGNTPSDAFTGYKLQIGSASDSQTFISIGNSTSGLGPLNGLVIGNDSTGADIYQRENLPLRLHTNNVERMRIFSDGNVLIQSGGTFTNNGARLQVSGTGRFTSTLEVEGGILGNSYIRAAGGSDLGSQLVLWANSSGNTFLAGFNFAIHTGFNNSRVERFFISHTGEATFSSSVTATSFFESSDATLKTLVADNYQAKGIDSVVAKLYIKNGKQELGYYAQDLQGILPSAVSKGADGLLNLSYREVHTAKIAALEKEVAELKQQLKNN